MPIAIDRRADEDLTIFTASGILTYSEQMEALRAFYEDTPTLYVIWDFRQITGERITTSQLRSIIAYIKHHAVKRPGGATALVSNSDEDYGLSRMGSTMAEIEHTPWAMEAFRDLHQAQDWINQQKSFGKQD